MNHTTVNPIVEIRLCVNSELIESVKNNPLHHHQKISEMNGEHFLDFSIQITPDFLHWIQCMGSSVEVIYPPELREWVRQNLTETLHKYRVV
jgi:predicted DNA-binding transcriptional regulator YafY